MRTIAAIAVLMLLGFAALAGDSAADLKAMQGQWSVTIVERDGKPAGDELKNVKLVLLVAGDEYRVLADDKAVAGGKFKIDAGKTPRRLDASITEGPNKGLMQQAIYEIKGDTMTAVYAKPGAARPTELKTKEDSGQSLVRYTRRKK